MLRIVTRDGRTEFRPGERLEGEASWELDRDPRSIELRLFWVTRGQANTDVGDPVVQAFENPMLVDRRKFSFTMPGEPYSFDSRYVTLVWALELVAEPGSLVERVELTMSPTGRRVELYHPASSGA